jgi:hypothetical protein
MKGTKMITITKNNHFLKAIAALAVSTIAAGSMMAYSATPAHAASQTFTVNTEGNAIGTGGCNAIQCTLNEALLEANANPGKDTINFNIPGSSSTVKVISPTFELPEITDPVLIDGYSQPGAQENTLATGGTNAQLKIRVDGSGTPNSPDGLRIAQGGANSTIQGLMITNFDGSGIEIQDPDGVKIEGNFLGVGSTGTTDLGNGVQGVKVFDDNTLTGGATIGGTTPAARNLISGNDFDGVEIIHGTDNRVLGNIIGTDRNGTANLGNGFNGVNIVQGSSDNELGDGTPEGANIIAFNGATFDQSAGVTIGSCNNTGCNLRNSVLDNSIFSNAGLGIDLNGDGTTPNDSGDPDSGPNDLQNFPVLESAEGTTIKGEFDSSKPNQTYRLQFFTNPSGTDEGKTFIGEKSVTLDSTGFAAFTFSASRAIPVGQNVTATATDPDGNTSEFSTPVESTDKTPPKVKSITPANKATGVGLLANVKATFSEDMLASSINAKTFKLFKKGSTIKVAASVSYDAATDRATLDPTKSLKKGATYKVMVTTRAKDLAGNRLDQKPARTGLQPKVWFFTVKS